MRSIIIGTKAKIGAGLVGAKTKDDIGELSEGAITIIRNDNNKLLSSSTTSGDKPFGKNNDFTPETTIQFAQGLADGHYLSPVIKLKDLVIEKTDYAAKVAKVMYVGKNASTGTWTMPTVADHIGEYASIRVYDLSQPIGVTNNVKVVSYLVKQGDTEADVFNNLFDKLEKLKGKFYANVEKETSGSDYGYKFTGFDGQNFNVIPELLISGSPVTTATNVGFGNGNADLLAEVEKDFATHKGFNNTNYLQNDLYTGKFAIDPDTNYDVFVLKWVNPNKHAIAGGDNPMRQHCLIAVPTGDTYPNTSGELKRALDSIMDMSTDNTWGVVVEEPTHSVTYSVEGSNGSVTAVANDEVISTGDDVTEGSDVLFIAEADDNFTVKQWTVDAEIVTGETGDTFLLENLTDNVTVTVEFEAA